jgi:hypothetical protein
MYKFKKIKKWESKPFVIYYVKIGSNGYQKYDAHPTLMQTIIVLLYVLKIPNGSWYQFFKNFNLGNLGF